MPSSTRPNAPGDAAGIPQNLHAHLLSFSHAVAGAPDEQTLASALSGVMSACDVASFHLWRARTSPEPYVEIVIAWDRNGEPSPRVGERIPRAELRALDSIAPGKPLIAADCAAHPTLDERIKRAAAERGARSVGIYPLVQQGEVFGALEIRHQTEHAPAPGEEQFFLAAAAITAMALLHGDSRAELRTKIRQLKALYTTAETISSITDPKAMIQKAAELIVSDIGYLNCFIALTDERANLLREAALAGVGDYPGRLPYNYSVDDIHIAGVSAFRAAQPLTIEDIQKRADAEGWGEVARASGMRSAGYVPLKADGKVVGVLSFGSTDARISDDELSLFGAFANQLMSTRSRLQMNIEREKQIAALERANENQARLLETVRELSTPVIPVHDGVLVLPLVGMIDTGRSAQVMESLLNAIQKEKASVVIIDITGVPTVDTGVANHLIRSTRAASLLGAMCVLVGVAPAVAQTLVLLGVDFGELVTRSDLQAGIAYALERIGRDERRR